jgi:hypothetical protein
MQELGGTWIIVGVYYCWILYRHARDIHLHAHTYVRTCIHTYIHTYIHIWCDTMQIHSCIRTCRYIHAPAHTYALWASVMYIMPCMHVDMRHADISRDFHARSTYGDACMSTCDMPVQTYNRCMHVDMPTCPYLASTCIQTWDVVRHMHTDML